MNVFQGGINDQLQGTQGYWTSNANRKRQPLCDRLRFIALAACYREHEKKQRKLEIQCWDFHKWLLDAYDWVDE